jgi:hypothetical protein
MAAYTVAAAKIGAYAKLAVASTVDSVTFAEDVQEVEIISDGAAALYVTVDGSTPTVAGANTWILPAGALTTRTLRAQVGNSGTVVKLISSGAPTYSVSRVS